MLAKPFVPSTRLSRLVDRDGGLWRDQAIGEAARGLAVLRERFFDILMGLIKDAEDAALPAPEMLQDRLCRLQRLANQIINLAGTFGLAALGEAAKRLCDLTSALKERDTELDDAILIHVQALRLFAPRAAYPGPEAASAILAELRRVLHHFEIPILEDAPPPPKRAEKDADKDPAKDGNSTG